MFWYHLYPFDKIERDSNLKLNELVACSGPLVYHVINLGACSPWTLSMAGQCVAPGGPQSCKPREFARRCVKRCAMLNPPLPSNCVSTIITCLWIEKGISMRRDRNDGLFTSAAEAPNRQSLVHRVLIQRCNSLDNRIWRESIYSRGDFRPSQLIQPSPR